MSITLPQRSILLDGGFRKAANAGTPTANYRLGLVDGASNIVPGMVSVAANQNVEHKGRLTAGTVLLIDDTAGFVAGISFPQVLFLVATAGNTGSAQAVAMANSDYAWLEYI